MNQLNSLILEGNLARDAVTTQPAPGFTKCNFTVGVNRFYKNRNNESVDEVSFFDVEAYGKLAEYCGNKAKKGRGVRVVGRLKQDTWKDASGKTASKIYVVAEHIEYKPEKKPDEVVEAKSEPKEEAPVQPEPQTQAETQTQAEAQPQPEPVLVEEAVF